MCKSANDLTVLYGYRWLAAFGMFNDRREILLLSVFGFGNISCTFQSAGTGNVDTVFVVCIRAGRYNTVTGKQYRTVEAFKLFFLLPPGVSVVSGKVFILFELRILVRW